MHPQKTPTGPAPNGQVSVSVLIHFSGRAFVEVSQVPNTLTPEESRALGALLIEVAERAEAETDTLSWDESGACNPPFISSEELENTNQR